MPALKLQSGKNPDGRPMFQDEKQCVCAYVLHAKCVAVSSPDALYSPNLDSHFQFADRKPSAFSLANMLAGLTSGKRSNPFSFQVRTYALVR